METKGSPSNKDKERLVYILPKGRGLLFSRVLLIVLDSVGIGELPDAYLYNDQGSNTLKNIAAAVNGLSLPVMESMGLGNIEEIKGVKKVDNPCGLFGKMGELSAGKDTTTGHWELMGIITDKPFPVYPNGFPKEIINLFEEAIGTKIIGNYPASGTEIIKGLGELHLKTKMPIVYTSADSVFQIACHKDIYPLPELYRMCQIARTLLVSPHNVGRVIARPFTGTVGRFVRTEERRDFSLAPTSKTVLDILQENRYEVISIGKIDDIFSGRGIARSYHTTNNSDTTACIKTALKRHKKGLIFANLIDFDMLYGHRNDPSGYASALKEFDHQLPDILNLLTPLDLLIITADHGNDPTTPSTDHTREYVPVILYSPSITQGKDIGIRKTFADVGATISYIFNVDNLGHGKNLLENITIA